MTSGFSSLTSARLSCEKSMYADRGRFCTYRVREGEGSSWEGQSRPTEKPVVLTRPRRSRWICDASLCLWKAKVAYRRVGVLLARGFEVR